MKQTNDDFGEEFQIICWIVGFNLAISLTLRPKISFILHQIIRI